MADIQATGRIDAPRDGQSIKTVVNWIGAAVSLLLIVGVCTWGYRLLVRDVSGVPVIRAASGPMRVQPDDPGGKLAENMGLAVNTVAAEGAAEAPADRLVLAPPPLDLTEEDAPAAKLTEEKAAQPQETATDETTGETTQDAGMEALLAELTAEAKPLAKTDEAAPEPAPEPAEETAAAADTETAPEVADGLAISLRPRVRPEQVVARLASTDAAVNPGSGPVDVDPATIAPGTRLVQLGAFDSPDVARSEWTRLSARFGDYLTGKRRVIQRAESGGRTFYRLRAMGFADLGDARRFCSALVAENADCIPVVTR
ncbi:SPOR domain-containing protein [Sediminimonas qiaohouensis]|uniref:SPOR domain-containing protein n=1 Tax=Sediminimonas qiaohouensis TaxID=552061 RepID=UPI00040ABC61|nr:SPOR domain-containing protein [Sediminimonas qiaohouensis]